jgi:hypothetical protein
VNSNKSKLVLVSVLFMVCVWGFAFAQRSGVIPSGLEIFIFLLIMISGVYAFMVHMKKHKDIEAGFPAEDELSEWVKYRAGYYSFIASIYIWLSLFLLKELFTDYDTLFGLGVLLPAVVFMALRSYLARKPHEDTH